VPKLRIAYSPQSLDLKHPVDRRRLIYWANKRGHEVVTDLETKADVLVLSGRADLAAWTRKQNRPPVILDLVDGYLGKEEHWRDWARGAGKVLTGQISGVPQPYRKIVSEACSLAQAVICETIEQESTILPFCKNVHSILDFHEEFPMLEFNYGGVSRNFPSLMWEGLPFTAKGLLQLRDSIKEIARVHPLAIEMVTDPTYPLVLGKYLYRGTEGILKDIPKILGENFTLTKWSLEAVVATAKKSHLSVLPLDPNGALNPLKAENRLLMMWRVGLPVLTSPSLAYSRVMAATDLDGICSTPSEWYKKILQMIESPELRANSVERGQQYIRDTHAEALVLEAWDNVFESVL
jgi:hypothetical protein